MAIDRERLTPFLLRTFVWRGHLDDTLVRYAAMPSRTPSDELHVHAWPDTTLRELCEQVKEVCAPARVPGCVMHLSLVFPDPYGRYKVRAAGAVASNKVGADDATTLAECRHVAGDLLDLRLEDAPATAPASSNAAPRASPATAAASSSVFDRHISSGVNATTGTT